MEKIFKEVEETSVELSDIIRQGIGDYIVKYGPLTRKQSSVVRNIIQCRTAALGGHLYKCDKCDYQILTYNSCRDRHCPKCQGVAQAVWVQQRVDELLPVGYFHVVFTLPHEFNRFVLHNKEVFYTILYKATSETLLELGRDPRWLGAALGFIAVLHTWGQKLLDHFHIHCIIPGGGIRLDGRKWVNSRSKYLFPIEVMSALYRGKFLDYFHKAVQQSQIVMIGELQEYTDSTILNNFLQQMRKKDWIVYAKEPFATAELVVKYLGRYTSRVALSNKRIISLKDKTVEFSWKDYADENKQKVMVLPIVEFIRRFFLHVLPQRFVRIRYYGLLSNGTRSKRLKRCFELLGKKYHKKEIATTIIERILQCLGIDIGLCPKCLEGHCYQSKELVKIPFRLVSQGA